MSPDTEFARDFCAGIGPLQLGVVLVTFIFLCILQDQQINITKRELKLKEDSPVLEMQSKYEAKTKKYRKEKVTAADRRLRAYRSRNMGGEISIHTTFLGVQTKQKELSHSLFYYFFIKCCLVSYQIISRRRSRIVS